MPIYEYCCESCGAQTEVIQKFSDAPLTECEQCKGPLKKLLSTAAFHLKGGGWYKTDYASPKSAADSSASSDGSGSSGGCSSGSCGSPKC